LQLTRSACVRGDCFYEDVEVTSYAPAGVRVEVSWRIGADFRDVFELRGLSRVRHGTLEAPELLADGVRYRYLGLDEVRRVTTVRAAPKPSSVEASRLRFILELGPRESRRLQLRVCCQTGEDAVEVLSWDEATRELKGRRHRDERGVCRAQSDNPLLNRWLERSSSDLAMLATDLPEGRVPYAGLPWFTNVFGRDAVTAAYFALWHDPELARGTLRCLAASQAKTYDPRRDAEPGKIIHEIREGEMAATGEVPFGRFYGSVDVTPLYVILAGAYYEATGDLDLIAELWPSVFRATAWIDVCGDRDGDGFVEYRPSPEGLMNQGWKSSPLAICHKDGSLAHGPIALCEVQAYVYAAKLHAARLAHELGDRAQAERLARDAASLRQRFDEAFWSDELSTFALALDGDKRPCLVRSSNAGHCLTFGLALPERVEPLMEAMLAPDLYSGWGVRTLSTKELLYNPASHHNGAVWPHDTALIAMGLGRWGLTQQASGLMGGLLEASARLELHRLPELLCGYDRETDPSPTPFPSACSPQAGAAASVFGLLAACLGMRIEGARGRLLLQHPRLPEGVDELTLTDLPLGEARVDLYLHRHKGHVGVTVTRLAGEGEVVIIP
jgi:glycogen debranching enzyme